MLRAEKPAVAAQKTRSEIVVAAENGPRPVLDRTDHDVGSAEAVARLVDGENAERYGLRLSQSMSANKALLLLTVSPVLSVMLRR